MSRQVNSTHVAGVEKRKKKKRKVTFLQTFDLFVGERSAIALQLALQSQTGLVVVRWRRGGRCGWRRSRIFARTSFL